MSYVQQFIVRRVLLPLAALVALGMGVWAVVHLLWPTPKDEKVVVLDPNEVIVFSTQGGTINVATLIKNEEFAWKSSFECPFIKCPNIFKPTTSTIRVPVHYTYSIPLAATWSMTLDRGHYLLQVPSPQPNIPPAIDLSKMEIRTVRGWLSPGTEGNREKLMRALGPELAKRAMQAHYFEMQRGVAQKTVLEFTAKWLREGGQQAQNKGLPVAVQFGNTPAQPVSALQF